MTIPNISRAQLEYAIDNSIILQRHAERNRQLMKRRLIDGLTYEQLAIEFDMSVQNVQKIVYKNMENLHKFLV